jgi:hypothetical protein
MDPYAGGRGSRALVAWLSVACTGLLLVALGNEAMHSWSARLGDQGSVTFANGAAGTGTWKRQPKVDPGAGASDRTRSRVLIERRSHSEDECAPFGRVPIAVMIACHQRDQSMNAGLTDMREIKHQMRRASSGRSSPWVIATSLTAAAVYAGGDRTGSVGSWRRGSIWEGHQRRYPVRRHGHEPAHQPQRDTAHRSQDGRDEKPTTGWPVAERGSRDGALARPLDHQASRSSPAQSTHGWRVGHA